MPHPTVPKKPHRAGGSTSSQNPVTPVHSAAGVGATSGVSAPDEASSRWMPTTSPSAVVCRTSSARSVPMKVRLPTLAPSGIVTARSSGGRPRTIACGLPRSNLASPCPSERIAVEASRLRKVISSPALPPVDGKSTRRFASSRLPRS